MKLVFLGPPGAGKGTVAKKISEAFAIPHISTGDLFRSENKSGTDLGKKVEGILTSGALVPDDVTIEIVKSRLQKPDTEKGFIMDGFPRTILQAQKLFDITRLNGVLNFEIYEDEVVNRLSGRRTCRNCGNMHHIEYMPPKQEGICDVCGGELYTREDDKPESIQKRLQVYKAQTEPLISFYREKKLLYNTDASATPEKVFRQVKDLLHSL